MSVPVARQLTPEFGSIPSESFQRQSMDNCSQLIGVMEEEDDYCNDCDGVCDGCHSKKPPPTKAERNARDAQNLVNVTISYDLEVVKEVVRQLQEHIQNKSR